MEIFGAYFWPKREECSKIRSLKKYVFLFFLLFFILTIIFILPFILYNWASSNKNVLRCWAIETKKKWERPNRRSKSVWDPWHHKRQFTCQVFPATELPSAVDVRILFWDSGEKNAMNIKVKAAVVTRLKLVMAGEHCLPVACPSCCLVINFLTKPWKRATSCSGALESPTAPAEIPTHFVTSSQVPQRASLVVGINING